MTRGLIAKFTRMLKAEWRQLTRQIVARAKKTGKNNTHAVSILEAYLNNSGKFIRPVFFLLGYGLYDSRMPTKKILRLALSFELLHLHLLVEDDIMDQSGLRRGKPSLHVALAKAHGKLGLVGDAFRYGESLAMLMSNMLLNEAERLWAEAVSRKLIRPGLHRYFAELKSEVYWGQYLDLFLAERSSFPSLANVITVMKEKTGKYSIFRPMQIGALVVGAKPKDIRWFYDLGVSLGVGFQIIDDFLGVFGKEKLTGKSTFSDITERKRTAIVYFAYKQADKNGRKALENHYLKKLDTLSPAKIKKILTESGAGDKARQMAEIYFQRGMKALNRANLSSDKKQILRQFAKSMIERKK